MLVLITVFHWLIHSVEGKNEIEEQLRKIKAENGKSLLVRFENSQ